MSREEIDDLITTGHELSKDEIRRTQQKRGAPRRTRTVIAVGVSAITLTVLIVVLTPHLGRPSPPQVVHESPSEEVPAVSGQADERTATDERTGAVEPASEEPASAQAPLRESSHAAESAARAPEAGKPRLNEASRNAGESPDPTDGGSTPSARPDVASPSPDLSRPRRTRPSPMESRDSAGAAAARTHTEPTAIDQGEAPVVAAPAAGRTAAAESAARDRTVEPSDAAIEAPEPDSAEVPPSEAERVQRDHAEPAPSHVAESTRGPVAPSANRRAAGSETVPRRNPPATAASGGESGMPEEELKAELRTAFAPPSEDDRPAPSTEPTVEPTSTPVPELAAAMEPRGEKARPSASAVAPNRGPPPGLLTPMVMVPAGRGHLGAIPGDRATMENERPAVSVDVKEFYLEEHEVTNRQYKAFLDDTGYPGVPRSDDPRFSKYDWDGETRTYPAGHADYPVVNVTRADAAAFARWAGRRLPTEVEWEYAARHSRSSALYPWGNSLANRLFANFDGSRLLPVASYPPNDLGLYDLAGNAFEWIGHAYFEDLHEWLAESPSAAGEITQRPERYGLLRGGAYYSTAREIRCSYREYNDPSVRYPGYGFRCAADSR